MNEIDRSYAAIINLALNMVILELNEFTLEELETLHNFIKKKYTDAIYIG